MCIRDSSGQGGWYLKRQLQYFKSGARGAHEDDVFGKQMAPMAATLIDDAAIDDVVAYIETLPDRPAPTTVYGNTANGKKFYKTCSYCHGAEAQGIQATNAPRAAGMSDWYLVTQLKNFQKGIRGRHPQDMYGQQMVLMADILADAQDIDDLVAYINTLK
jgi:cytochrome c oxidase subunit 2